MRFRSMIATSLLVLLAAQVQGQEARRLDQPGPGANGTALAQFPFWPPAKPATAAPKQNPGPPAPQTTAPATAPQTAPQVPPSPVTSTPATPGTPGVSTPAVPGVPHSPHTPAGPPAAMPDWMRWFTGAGETTPKEANAEQFNDAYRQSWMLLGSIYHREAALRDWAQWKTPAEPIKDRDSFDKAMKAMAASFNDPYTDYISTADIKKAREESESGILSSGLDVKIENGRYVIHYVSYGSPAYVDRTIRKGDVLIAVDRKPVKGMPLADLEQLLKQKKGVTFEVVVEHAGVQRAVSLVYTDFAPDAVEGRVLRGENTVIYVRLPDFMSPQNVDLVLQAFSQGYEETGGHAAALILDLRGNPGGRVDVAVELNKRLQKRGVIFTMTSRADGNATDTCERAIPEPDYLRKTRKESANKVLDMLLEKPLYVLIDGSSASCSEITTGALKDNKRAVIVGPERTFGKGVAYKVFPLPKPIGGQLKITSGHYVTPNGHDLAVEGGIEPDIRVSATTVGTDVDPALARVMQEVSKNYFEPRHFLATDSAYATTNGDKRVSGQTATLVLAIVVVFVVWLRRRQRPEEPF